MDCPVCGNLSRRHEGPLLVDTGLSAAAVESTPATLQRENDSCGHPSRWPSRVIRRASIRTATRRLPGVPSPRRRPWESRTRDLWRSGPPEHDSPMDGGHGPAHPRRRVLGQCDSSSAAADPQESLVTAGYRASQRKHTGGPLALHHGRRLLTIELPRYAELIR